jgi:hypothetical protein
VYSFASQYLNGADSLTRSITRDLFHHGGSPTQKER